MVPKNSQADREYDIGITGEVSYYNAAEETFDFCDAKTEETCYVYDDGGGLNYYCAAVSSVYIHDVICYFLLRLHVA